MRHKTVRHSPQQNGVVERLNRTIMERVKCQLADVMLPARYWVEAAFYTVYTLNRCPHTSINFLTLGERWSGKPPKLQHLIVFGCVGFVHQDQGKLKAKVVKCMLLEFTKGVKGYKLWHPTEKKCVSSRDIIFREQEIYSKISQRITIHKIKTLESIQEENESQDEEEATETVHEQQDLQTYSLARDKQRRNIIPPTRSSEVDCISLAILSVVDSLNIKEPNNFEEAMNGPNNRSSIEVMNEEMRSLEENETWTLKPLPKGYKPIDSKWIYKVKERIIRVIKPKFKVRPVAKGYTKKERIDYTRGFFFPCGKIDLYQNVDLIGCLE